VLWRPASPAPGVEDPFGADVLPLASVSPAAVNLQPGSRTLGAEDTIIGLVGTIKDAEQHHSGSA
jgi:hypothetical protein